MSSSFQKNTINTDGFGELENPHFEIPNIKTDLGNLSVDAKCTTGDKIFIVAPRIIPPIVY